MTTRSGDSVLEDAGVIVATRRSWRVGGAVRAQAADLRVGMAAQQIQHYEANDYRSNSLARLCDIAKGAVNTKWILTW